MSVGRRRKLLAAGFVAILASPLACLGAAHDRCGIVLGDTLFGLGVGLFVLGSCLVVSGRLDDLF